MCIKYHYYKKTEGMWKDTVIVGLWGGCWSLSQHPAWTRRRQGISLVKSSVHLSALSEQIGVVPGSKVPQQCSEGVLAPLMLPALFPTFVRKQDWNQKPSSQPPKTALLVPTDLHISRLWKVTCQGETASAHLSCGTPLYMKLVLFPISSLFQRGAGEWLHGYLKLDCLYSLL